jgi:hypothetical protein
MTFVSFAPFWVLVFRFLEVSLTGIVSTVAIQLDSLAGSFARSATVFAVRLWRAAAGWVLTFFFVSHNSLLNSTENKLNNGEQSLTYFDT